MKSQEIQRVSITDSVVKKLRESIQTGEYKPGEKLPTEVQLCESFGVSRTCVREALRVLQALRLVEILPGRGAFVAQKLPTEEESTWYAETDAQFYDFIEVRMAIEPLATRLAIERATDEQIEGLDEILRSFVEASDNKDLTKMIMLDELFHSEIIKIAGNKLLMNINKELSRGNKKYRSESFLDNTVYRNAIGPHTKIMECFHKRDPEAGAREMFNHLSITKNDMDYLQRKRNR